MNISDFPITISLIITTIVWYFIFKPKPKRCFLVSYSFRKEEGITGFGRAFVNTDTLNIVKFENDLSKQQDFIGMTVIAFFELDKATANLNYKEMELP